MRRGLLLLATACAALSLAACATYKDELARGETAFDRSSYDEALGILRQLENDQGHLHPEERARYAYLRGMTDYRIGYQADARHWLLVAQAMEAETPGQLPPEWKPRLDEAVTALNEQVYTGGIENLSTALPAKGK